MSEQNRKNDLDPETKKYLKRAALVAGGLTVGSLVPAMFGGPKENEPIKPSIATTEVQPTSSTVLIEIGEQSSNPNTIADNNQIDTIQRAVESEVVASGHDIHDVDITELTDQAVALNGGSSEVYPGQQVAIPDVPDKRP